MSKMCQTSSTTNCKRNLLIQEALFLTYPLNTTSIGFKTLLTTGLPCLKYNAVHLLIYFKLSKARNNGNTSPLLSWKSHKISRFPQPMTDIFYANPNPLLSRASNKYSKSKEISPNPQFSPICYKSNGRIHHFR